VRTERGMLWQMIMSLVLLTCALAAIPAPVPPNIVVFLADDHGFLDSEVYGSKDVPTPNMLRLAQAGMTFMHAFVASPSCAPAVLRSSLDSCPRAMARRPITPGRALKSKSCRSF
jgi:uncharacterized sulfatase